MLVLFALLLLSFSQAFAQGFIPMLPTKYADIKKAADDENIASIGIRTVPADEVTVAQLTDGVRRFESMMTYDAALSIGMPIGAQGAGKKHRVVILQEILRTGTIGDAVWGIGARRFILIESDSVEVEGSLPTLAAKAQLNQVCVTVDTRSIGLVGGDVTKSTKTISLDVKTFSEIDTSFDTLASLIDPPEEADAITRTPMLVHRVLTPEELNAERGIIHYWALKQLAKGVKPTEFQRRVSSEIKNPSHQTFATGYYDDFTKQYKIGAQGSEFDWELIKIHSKRLLNAMPKQSFWDRLTNK
ncbi:MAG: hypothetical protein ACYDBB_04880 [Armatimonadota bacterium]